MAFVKLDCGMLDSTTWFDKDVRDIFITALLMAVPREYDNEQSQLEVSSLKNTGWMVPAGWYGFVDAASLGIINRCGIPNKDGISALERLGSPEAESRSQSHGGRRLVRVDGGFLILNFINYREKDHTAAERQRRYRARQRAKSNAVTSRNITQAEAEAEAYIKPLSLNAEVWQEYEQHRKDVKAPKLSKRGTELAQAKLCKLSLDDQRTCVELSISNGWRGLFPDKAKPTKHKLTYSEQLKSDMIASGQTEGLNAK